MALISWSESFETKIKEIDNQHMKLVDIINSLSDGIRANKGTEITCSILDELIEYTVYHFETEEKFMDEYNYPLANEHKVEHKVLTNQVIDLQKRVKDGSYSITFEVLQFLKNWLTEHLLNTDKKFGVFLKSHNLN